MSWQTAHRVAAIAATQAHDGLGIDPCAIPVAVAPAIHRAGVVLLYRPLPTLFGAYLTGRDIATGILVNNRLTRAVRRHSAAHELGHHRLGHQCTLDSGALEDSGESLRDTRRGGWPDHEKTAEAFAAWFLMPRRAVHAVLADMGVAAPTGAEQIYQLALRLGTSYAATVRHLATLKMISRPRAQQLGSISPGVIKRRLASQDLSSTRDVEVWDLSLAPRHTPAAVASSGDLLLVPGTELQNSAGPVEDIGVNAQSSRLLVCTEPTTLEAPVSVATESGSYSLLVQSRPAGLYLSSLQTAAPIPGDA